MDLAKFKTNSSLNISNEVVSTIAKNAIKEIDGVFALSIIPVKYTMWTTPTAVKAVKIYMTAETAQVDIGIVVNISYKIKDVCEQVQNAVKDAIQNMAGIAVSKVNIFVTGVNIPM